jgi:sec-independent protein translocase protein TatA
MGTLSPWHILIIAVLVLVIFGGRGKLSGIMGDAAKGIRAFKDGLKAEDEPKKPADVAQPLPRAAEKEQDPIVR